MTESADRPETEHGPSTPSARKVQSTGRDGIDTSEKPTEELVDGKPIPETWAEYGRHMAMSRFDMRLFAATAKEHEDTLLIKYIHPVNPDPLVVEYDAIETQEERVAPKQLVDTVKLGNRLGTSPDEISPHTFRQNDIKPFPVSIGVDHVDPSPELEEPTTAERNLIWALYEEFLANETLYTPPDK